MIRHFPATQVDDLTVIDRLRLAWRDFRFGRARDVFSAEPPGHFYTPIPALDEVKRADAAIWAERPTLPGVDLRVQDQLRLAAELGRYAKDAPFRDRPVDGLRYHFDNSMFGQADGVVYHSLLRHWQPRRIVEVGSGFSTALLLDTVDRNFDHSPEIVAIEPHTERLRSLLRPGETLRIVEAQVQSVDIAEFTRLEAGDLLFIDSSHVSKVGSDVNYLFLDVLPRLTAGVRVHVHDMHYPEYPRGFIYGGMHWNELYLVRALLIGNPHLRVLWWNGFLAAHHADEVSAAVPGWAPHRCSSLWLETA